MKRANSLHGSLCFGLVNFAKMSLIKWFTVRLSFPRSWPKWAAESSYYDLSYCKLYSRSWVWRRNGLWWGVLSLKLYIIFHLYYVTINIHLDQLLDHTGIPKNTWTNIQHKQMSCQWITDVPVLCYPEMNSNMSPQTKNWQHVYWRWMSFDVHSHCMKHVLYTLHLQKHVLSYTIVLYPNSVPFQSRVFCGVLACLRVQCIGFG